MHPPTTSRLLLLLAFTSLSPALLPAQRINVLPAPIDRHDDPVWASIEKHLPDPATASAATLETEADILRARRFPEDALRYYQLAAEKGADKVKILNKLGLTELELNNFDLARGYFKQAVKLNRHDPHSWNNLGAIEYLERNYRASVKDYRKAIKADKRSALYHANLSTAYFAQKNYKRAVREASTALQLDPEVFRQRNGIGVSARLLSVADRGRYYFEMAKLYAERGQEKEMLHSLAKASENGFDILSAMRKDPVLAKYKGNPSVMQAVATADALRRGELLQSATATQPKPAREEP